MPTSAKVICDSVSESGQRITTMVLEYPRIIHSEFMTHRMFSRNASSSRAIPVEKQIERVHEDGFIPTQFGKNKRGMQASENLDAENAQISENCWRSAKDSAVSYAYTLNELGVHKQLVNRLLEPFSHIQVVVTATEWSNFFLQRLDKNAQPEIQELARVMKEAMDASKPILRYPNDWHLPFISPEDRQNAPNQNWTEHFEYLRAISVARCARVSYGLNERGWGDIEKDLALYDMLFSSGHWSPFEHQATPMNNYEQLTHPGDWQLGITHMDRYLELWSGNFKGWIQNRALIQQV